MVTELKAVMRDIPLFAGLSTSELDRIARVMRPVQAAPGEVVCLEGQPGYLFFVIADGEVAVEHDGRTIAELHTGDHFGELALLDHVPRSATVRTLTETQLYVLGESSFDALIKELPALEQKLAMLAVRRRRAGDADGRSGPLG